jgi:ATP-binding cassette, subfamily B, bacterial
MKDFYKIIKSYKGLTLYVTVLGLLANVLSLYVPKLGAQVIDGFSSTYSVGIFSWSDSLSWLTVVALITLVIAVVQIYVSAYFSEKVAYDLRNDLINKISNQTFSYVSMSTPGRLLTVLTSDIDAVKNVISQGLVTLLGAVVTLIGSAILLITINLQLALYTLSVIPFLILTFFFIFGTLASLFRQGQENLEKINAMINETIIGAALVRVLDSASTEIKKFFGVNQKSKELGFAVVRNISSLIPIIMLLANITTIIIIWFGGSQVVNGTLTVGNFSAFIAYSAMFIWPLFVLSFVGTSISRGGVSLKRINDVINASVQGETGSHVKDIQGNIEFKNVSLVYKNEEGEEKTVLKNISFSIDAHTKCAILGPTAAGKTQIFYLLAGLVLPTSGEILIDGVPMNSYLPSELLTHIGLVFQESIIFNTTLRDNIALSNKIDDHLLKVSIDTAELSDLLESLPKGLDTLVSERGTSLSGGQKQRIMLARALAINPDILLLDDFTSRVDNTTEARILSNVALNYPDVTLISITQKVEPIKDYQKIIVIMEGELVAIGSHSELLENSFEYRQILESQISTENISSKK